MSIRTALPLFSLFLLASCGGSAASDENTSSASQALGGDQDRDDRNREDKPRVLLISVDGMHQSDLDWYVENHRHSTLAKLVHSGSEYTHASTSNPSDSDPGGTALMTGGNPKSTANDPSHFCCRGR